MLNYSGDVDRVLHALADPTRRQIVERLGSGPRTVSELAEPLPMSMPAVVQHLQVLERSGVIATEKRGRTRTCRLEWIARNSGEVGDRSPRRMDASPRPS